MRDFCTILAISACILLVMACNAPQDITPGSSVPLKPAESSTYPLPSDGERPAGVIAPPMEAPVPKSGTASLSGLIYSVRVKYVLPDTQFYLKRVSANPDQLLPLFSGPDPRDGDILSKTDRSGLFQISDVPPGEYYLAVWYFYSWLPAISSPTSTDLLLIKLQPDQRAALGVVNVPWP